MKVYFLLWIPIFSIFFQASATGSQICTHDVPVLIIPKKEWDDYKEPTITDYNVSLL